MDRLVSDRGFKLIVLIVGIILAVDVVNVFVVGGPSVSSLLFRPGNAVAASEVSSLPPENNQVSPVYAPPADTVPRGAGGNISAVQKVGSPSATMPAIYVPTKETPVPVVQYCTEVTPIVPSKDEPVERYVPLPTPTPLPDEYVTIYSKNLTYPNEPTALAFDIKEAPLVIRYTVSPTNIHDFKVATNRTATKAYPEISFNITRPSEDAWFTVTVFDRETGQRLEDDGYGETYGLVPEHTFTVHETGKYLIQFDGANANVQIDMRIKRKGNIA
jgi:hypothetical protein